jgi:hypothetical protein
MVQPEAMINIAYFAYGSNMLTGRLRYLVPSTKLITVAKLPKHQLRFHKRSADGSGKCNAFFTGDEIDVVFGPVFEIPARQKRILDKFEGLGKGYSDACVNVSLPDGSSMAVQTYFAEQDYIDDDLKPYDWYKAFVVRGAEEHRLPQSYVNTFIKSVPEIPDPNDQREMNRPREVYKNPA